MQWKCKYILPCQYLNDSLGNHTNMIRLLVKSTKHNICGSICISLLLVFVYQGTALQSREYHSIMPRPWTMVEKYQIIFHRLLLPMSRYLFQMLQILHTANKFRELCECHSCEPILCSSNTWSNCVFDSFYIIKICYFNKNIT